MPSIGTMIGPQHKERVRDAIDSQRVERSGFYVPIEVKEAKADKDDGRLYFEGYANTNNIDRAGDIVEPKAFSRSLKGFLKNNPQVLYMHDWYTSVGSIVDAKVDDKGLWVRGFVQPAEDDKGEPLYGSWGEYLRFIRGQVKRGQLRTLSIGFRILETKQIKATDPMTRKEREVRVITALELYEISLVTIPANRESVVSARSAFSELHGDDVAKSLIFSDDDEQANYVRQSIKIESSKLEAFVASKVQEAVEALRKEMHEEDDESPNDGESYKLVDLSDQQDETFTLVSIKETER